jgi:hypothetical protein
MFRAQYSMRRHDRQTAYDIDGSHWFASEAMHRLRNAIVVSAYTVWARFYELIINSIRQNIARPWMPLAK